MGFFYGRVIWRSALTRTRLRLFSMKRMRFCSEAMEGSSCTFLSEKLILFIGRTLELNISLHSKINIIRTTAVVLWGAVGSWGSGSACDSAVTSAARPACPRGSCTVWAAPAVA